MATAIWTSSSPRGGTIRWSTGVLLNDGKGGFVASNLGPAADRTYTAALTDADGDGDLDVLTSNDTPDRKLVFLNNGKGQFTEAGTWGVAEWSTQERRHRRSRTATAGPT